MVAPSYAGADGIAAVTRQYVAALRRPEVAGRAAVEVWSLAEGARPQDLPADVAFAGGAGRRAAFALLPLRARDVGDHTLVLVMHVHLLAITLPLVWRRARVAVLLHGIEAWRPLRVLERRAAVRAWKIAAVSAHTALRFRQANPAFQQTVIHVCSSGVPEGAVPTESGVPGGFALIVGRMAAAERYKGHDVLIDVWPSVRERVPGARLVVVGGGEDLDRLRARAYQDCPPEAILFTGKVSGGRLAALYRDAAFFVMPSVGEGFGLVYLEAMSAGTPCIAVRGAAGEIMQHDADGVIVEPGDPDALRAAIVDLFMDGERRTRLGRQAVVTVSARYSAEAFARRVGTLIDRGGDPRC